MTSGNIKELIAVDKFHKLDKAADKLGKLHKFNDKSIQLKSLADKLHKSYKLFYKFV